jgi:hypothetical protein
MIVHYIYDTGFAVMPRNYGLAAAASLMLGWCFSCSRLCRCAFTRGHAMAEDRGSRHARLLSLVRHAQARRDPRRLDDW